MLFKNQLFNRQDEVYRLLDADPSTDRAWVIAIKGTRAGPIELPYSEIQALPAAIHEQAAHRQPSRAALLRRDVSWTRIEHLLKHGRDLFDPWLKARAIEEAAALLGCSLNTLRKDLRRYWQRGQTKEALIADYANCGRTLGGITANRGAKSEHYSTYQITDDDRTQIEKAIEGYYLIDERRTITDAFDYLLTNSYCHTDGNGKVWINDHGTRPTLRQFSYYLNKHYSLEVRLRKRKGDKEFDRDHSHKLGSTRIDCRGVGDIYEIDATIADVHLVSRTDAGKIIGKPTLYFIIDRESRLIVGFYFGLENPCWVGAMQAMLSISMNKAELCKRYGVEYEPEDWPADGVFPSQFLGDMGEMVGKASTQVADYLNVTIANAPALRADWKPNVECSFKLFHETIRAVAPAYDSSANAKKRRKKHYDKEACLTLEQFGKLVIEAVIKHNRCHINNFKLTPDHLDAGVQPTPIELWSYGIQNRAGLPSRYSEEHVRYALLPRATARITQHGIEYEGCTYSGPTALKLGWFVNARKHRQSVQISYDPRLIDAIYVHDGSSGDKPWLAELVGDSISYKGLSFGEVLRYQKLQKAVRQVGVQDNLQTRHEFRERTQPTIQAAKRELANAGRMSRSSRRNDVKPQRLVELQHERLASALPEARRETNTSSAAVITHPASVEAQTIAPAISSTGRSPQSDALRKARARITTGLA